MMWRISQYRYWYRWYSTSLARDRSPLGSVHVVHRRRDERSRSPRGGRRRAAFSRVHRRRSRVPKLIRRKARGEFRRRFSRGRVRADVLSRDRRRKPGGFLSRESVVAARAERGSIRILLLLLRVREVSRARPSLSALDSSTSSSGWCRLQSLRARVAKHPRKLLRLSSNRARVLQQEIQLVGVHGQQFIHHGLWESRARRLHPLAHPLEEVVILGSRSDVFGRRRHLARSSASTAASAPESTATSRRSTGRYRLAASRNASASDASSGRSSIARRRSIAAATPASAKSVSDAPRSRTREQSRATAVPKPRAKAKTKAKTKRRARTPPSPPPRACRRETRATTRRWRRFGSWIPTRIAAAVGSGHVAGLGRARAANRASASACATSPRAKYARPREAAKNQRAETPKPPAAYDSPGCVFVRVRFASVVDAASACVASSRHSRSRSTTTSRSRRESSRVDILSDTCRTGMRMDPSRRRVDRAERGDSAHETADDTASQSSARGVASTTRRSAATTDARASVGEWALLLEPPSVSAVSV